MGFRILSSQMTEEIGLVAKGIVADKAYDRLPILADAIEDGGRVLDRYESEALRADRCNAASAGSGGDTVLCSGCNKSHSLPNWIGEMLVLLCTETPETLRAKEADAVEAKRVATFRQSAFAKCGLTGNGYSIKRLMEGITRRRPKGSGSKRDLAQRLEERLNELAARRWLRECKGQRKPTERQLADLMAAVEEAVDAAQVRAKERRIDVADVLAVAVKADRTGSGHRDGGRVTASSYGYSWSTSTVTAERMPGGLIRVVVNRTTRREVVAPARHWMEAASA